LFATSVGTRAFAGHGIDQAVSYPEDDRFLVDREVRRFELVAPAENASRLSKR
jgi:hypothetical protein